MSNVCCKEFNGWLKSFTKLERALALLEGVLLVLLFALLVLLILHLVACSGPDYTFNVISPASSGSIYPSETLLNKYSGVTQSPKVTVSDDLTNETGIVNVTSSPEYTNRFIKTSAECSWTPSAKTTAVTHYYEYETTRDSLGIQTNGTYPDSNRTNNTKKLDTKANKLEMDSTTIKLIHVIKTELPDSSAAQVDDEFFIQSQQSDGEDAEEESVYVAALVKLKPPKDVIFGCILTIITKYWTLTAASCIEAIEEMDSLDSFVITQDYGSSRQGPLQTLEDVQIHPLYEGKNSSFDLAALKSAGSLVKAPGFTVELASMLDLALVTVGERLTILGYGAFRSIDGSATGRRVRRALVHAVSARQCAGAAAAGAALRHLSAGRAVRGGGGGAAGGGALCAAVLGARARALPCNYCGGAPLLRGAALLAVMADNRQCGVACEPQLYVALPPLRDWIAATVGQ